LKRKVREAFGAGALEGLLEKDEFVKKAEEAQKLLKGRELPSFDGIHVLWSCALLF
jgi:hypothetical protein